MAIREITPKISRTMTARATVSALLEVPAPVTSTLVLRYAALAERDTFGKQWKLANFNQNTPGHFQLDLNQLGLPDGTYEYDLLIDGTPRRSVPDPFARELTKFGGYRSTFTIAGGSVVADSFDWSDEIPAGLQLPENNKIVIYEMPLRWMATAEQSRQVSLGSFEKLVFEHLDDLHALGVNCIELLPAQDSADTLNWGYGTRFFFAPDWDLGTPIDMKCMIKRCHQYGIRVILDVVMNHSRECPLETLAEETFYLPKGSTAEGTERQDWGGRLFRYATPVDGAYHSRDLMYEMAAYWIREYHIDGFRIDEWKGIGNWDFLQEFRDRARAEFHAHFPDRPFLVVAEDSWRRPEITNDNAYNGHPLVDAAWNFDFRDELRRLLNNDLNTVCGQPSRFDRIQKMLSCKQLWNDLDHQYRANGFTDLAKAVNYVTSHDVAGKGEQRLMNYFLGEILRYRKISPPAGSTETEFVRDIVDNISRKPGYIQAVHSEALERIASSFALLLTSVGVPMFLAGEEFADVHDIDNANPDFKQSDPVDFRRRNYLGHGDLVNRVGELVRLRTQHTALQRNEIEFFHSHPTINDNDGVRVFAYCRTAGRPLGSNDQVIVIANTGPSTFYAYNVPWSWPASTATEYGRPMGATIAQQSNNTLTLSLAPFQVRVFAT